MCLLIFLFGNEKKFETVRTHCIQNKWLNKNRITFEKAWMQMHNANGCIHMGEIWLWPLQWRLEYINNFKVSKVISLRVLPTILWGGWPLWIICVRVWGGWPLWIICVKGQTLICSSCQSRNSVLFFFVTSSLGELLTDLHYTTLVEQDLLTLLEHRRSPAVCCEVCIFLCSIFWIVVCVCVVVSFFSPWYCRFLFDLWVYCSFGVIGLFFASKWT